MGGDKQRMVLAILLTTVFMATSQDAHSSHQSHRGMAPSDDPVCSEQSAEDSVKRMKAVQSLRETQIEVEMMKKQQEVAAGR